MRFLCRAPAPEFAARSTLLRGLLRIVRTRLFKFTPSLLLTDEFEHVLFRLHSPGVLDLFGLTCVDEALLNDVPWIAMIFVRHLAAARVAHRETPSGLCRNTGQTPCRAAPARRSLLLRLLRRDQQQPLDLASRVPQGLIDVAEVRFTRGSGRGRPTKVPRIRRTRPTLPECSLPRGIGHRRGVWEDLAHGSSDDFGAMKPHDLFPHLVHEPKDVLGADRNRD